VTPRRPRYGDHVPDPTSRAAEPDATPSESLTTTPAAPATPQGGRPLRRDAARNRQRILDAAQQVFSEQGVNAPIEDIAKRAGVGVATLYRRFPNRPDLIACAFATKMQAYAEATEQALAAQDPWDGFCWFVERVCQMQADDHGLADVLTMTFPMSPQFRELNDRAYVRFATLVRRAKRTGRLREDFTTEDLPLILMANAGVLTATGTAAPDAWRRVVGLILQALHAPARGPLPEPPTPEQMYAAMQRGATEPHTGATPATLNPATATPGPCR
jgi:AcrR family transcriptional regulator